MNKDRSLWTKQEVEARFEEAAETLYRLPNAYPQSMLTSWPPVIRDFYERLMEEKEMIYGPPTAKAIDQMDEVLEWFQYLDLQESRIIWLRANRVKWRLIAPRFKITRQTAWRYWVYALEKIAYKLNQK